MPKEQEAKALMDLLDAITDKLAMECTIEQKIYPAAIFHAQQMTEKAAKACLALRNNPLTGHEYMHLFRQEIIPVSGELEKDFLKLFDIMVTLQGLCSPSRYSVSASRTRYRRYPEKDVLMFCRSADQFFKLCYDFIEIKTGLTLPKDKEELTNFILKEYGEAYIDIIDLL